MRKSPARLQPSVADKGPSRRRVLRNGLLAGGAAVTAGLLARPAVVLAESARPKFTHGLQSGDVSAHGGLVWARADRPSRLLLEVATSESLANAQRLRGPAAIAASDFTAKMDLTDLPAGQDIFYRVQFEDLRDSQYLSEPLVGHFRTAPADRR